MARVLARLGFGLSGFLVLVAGAAAGEMPAYRAADVERHFTADADLGASRSLCIGTDSECAKDVPGRPKVSSGFDLTVNFDYNSDTLTEGAKANLNEFAKALRGTQLGQTAFRVEGHTDAKGSDSFNLDLSARRASAVVRYLAEHGVDASRLEPKAYGKSRPRVENPADPANRRVEARVREE